MLLISSRALQLSSVQLCAVRECGGGEEGKAAPRDVGDSLARCLEETSRDLCAATRAASSPPLHSRLSPVPVLWSRPLCALVWSTQCECLAAQIGLGRHHGLRRSSSNSYGVDVATINVDCSCHAAKEYEVLLVSVTHSFEQIRSMESLEDEA